MTLTLTAQAQDTLQQVRDAQTDARPLFDQFCANVARAEAELQAGRPEESAVYAAIAAHMALAPHPGFFSSPRLERLLVAIGRATLKSTPFRRVISPKRRVRSILHVVTELKPVGGHSGMLGRWIAADHKRLHSVALTQHVGPLTSSVEDGVKASGGEIYRLNKLAGGPVAWAQALRDLAQRFDIVVLHVYSQDVVPSIAFSTPGANPPVLLLNHGDHIFWLGVATSDVVINLRDAATELSITRRGVEPSRNVMTPTLIAPPQRTRSREEAKRALGLPPDCVFLFSAARAMKYRSVGGHSFADTHAKLLERRSNAILWALGPDEPQDWKKACARVGGRMRGLPESPDTQLYFEAADIYVDSFPFVSSTSMMEAAGLGTPLVSRFYGEPEARIFAINHPGICAPTLHGATEADYLSHLDRLICDPALRAAKGEEARQAVLHYHTAPGWLHLVERAYTLAVGLAPINPDLRLALMPGENFSRGEPDDSLYKIFGYAPMDPNAVAKIYLGQFPLRERLALWPSLCAAGQLPGLYPKLRALLPDWLARTIRP